MKIIQDSWGFLSQFPSDLPGNENSGFINHWSLGLGFKGIKKSIFYLNKAVSSLNFCD
ncbi:hypothetical protein [Flexithrix dorotheae]|uniref:hypothetical protein n=1 Tax=Flexithrix dorotheae TaxID=70993 RepID=UPI00035FCE9D|nr:hypothetical protein [Flexithrix dorotheae]